MGTYEQVNNSFLTSFEMAPEKIIYAEGASSGNKTTLLYYSNSEKQLRKKTFNDTFSEELVLMKYAKSKDISQVDFNKAYYVVMYKT